MNPFLKKKKKAPTQILSDAANRFTASKAGIAYNTAAGLLTPAPYLKVAKDIFQGTARSAASAGLTVAKPFGGVDTLQQSDLQTPVGKVLYKAFLGSEPVKAIEDRIAEAEIAIKDSPFAQRTGVDKFALPLAFGGVFGVTALDLTPFGSLEKNAIKELVNVSMVDDAVKVLRVMNVPENVATRFAPDFANAKTVEEVQDIFNILKGVVGTDAAKTVEDIPTVLKPLAIQNKLSICKNCLDESLKQADLQPGLTVQRGIFVPEAKTAEDALEIATEFYSKNPMSTARLGKNTHAWNVDSQGDVFDFHQAGGRVTDSHKYVSEALIQENMGKQPTERFLKEALSERERDITKLRIGAEAHRKAGREEMAQIYEGQIKDYMSVNADEFAEAVRKAPKYFMDSNIDPFLRFKNKETNLPSVFSVTKVENEPDIIKQALDARKARLIDEGYVKPAKQVSQEDPLITEARKYKSAEEFVKAQQQVPFSQSFSMTNKLTAGDESLFRPSKTSVYHGTDALNIEKIISSGELSPRVSKFDDARERVVSLSKNRNIAETQGGSVVFEFKNNKVKTRPAPGGVIKGDGLIDGFEVRSDTPLKLSDVETAYIHIKKGEDLNSPIKDVRRIDRFGNTEIYDKDTYAGVKDKLEKAGIKVTILDENLTKSQLTDLWNKANKKTAPAKAIGATTGAKTRSLPELENQLELAQIQREMLNDSPLKRLSKYASKTGQEKGTLREVTGKAKGKFASAGDDITSTEEFANMGLTDTEQVRKAYTEYRNRVADVEAEISAMKLAIKEAKATASKGIHVRKMTRSRDIPYLEKTALMATRGVDELPTRLPPIQQATVDSLETTAQRLVDNIDLPTPQKPLSLEEIVTRTPLSAKVNALDYIRTPDRVLRKIGFAKEAELLRRKYDDYLLELPKNIAKITAWSERVSPDASKRLFQYLDGQDIKLSDEELKVATEMRAYLKEWADRLGLPDDNRVAKYITHLFDEDLIAKEFDEDLAKIITDKLPGEVYDPFLQKRLGAKGYKQDVWAALDAYTKRATRKVHIDEALERIRDKAGSSVEYSNLELSQYNFVKRYIDRVNMRPTELDNMLDNAFKQVFGYRLGQRPVLRVSQALRRMTYRGMLGLNLGSAMRNLSQGINTYATLGERSTIEGYMKLMSPAARKELVSEGVLADNFIQDRALSSTKKAIEKIDKGLWFFFDQAEKINRGAAYLGAKAKGLRKGMTELEAISYAKSIVRKTQFAYDAVDTPMLMGPDILKSLFQLQTFTTKQTEFLVELAKDKNFIGLTRYTLAGLAFVYTIGKAFGMEPKELLPMYRFDTPPSLKFPVEVAKAVLDVPDKYGNDRDLKEKMEDIGNSAIGLIPGGMQFKKTFKGYQAVQEGESQDAAGRTQYDVGGSTGEDLQAILFGKYATPGAKEYYNRKDNPKKKPTSNPFLK